MTRFDEDDAPRAAAATAANRRRGAPPPSAAGAATLPGGRWALVFGLGLPAAFVIVIAARHWRDHGPTPQEIIVQLPVPADNATPPDNRRDLPADDPGDNP